MVMTRLPESGSMGTVAALSCTVPSVPTPLSSTATPKSTSSGVDVAQADRARYQRPRAARRRARARQRAQHAVAAVDAQEGVRGRGQNSASGDGAVAYAVDVHSRNGVDFVGQQVNRLHVAVGQAQFVQPALPRWNR